MKLLNELLDMLEARKNHMGENEYLSFGTWKNECKKVNPEVWFDGDEDICNAMVGPRPYRRGETRAIGEWDGAVGSVMHKAPAAPVAEGVELTKEQFCAEVEKLVKSQYGHDDGGDHCWNLIEQGVIDITKQDVKRAASRVAQDLEQQ